MLCHVPSTGSCSQFCFVLQPHRVAVPFPPTFASPWRNSFVQIQGGTTLLKAKFGTTPQKRPKSDLNFGVGSPYGTNKPPLPNPSFPYEYGSTRCAHCNILYIWLHTLERTAPHCTTLNALQYIWLYALYIWLYALNALQHTATHCSTPQHTAAHCDTLQHTATLCTMDHLRDVAEE